MEPVSRIEKYLDRMANGGSGDLPAPVSRIEHYLAQIAEGGGSGGGGSSLPSVSSADVGKILAVQANPYAGTTVIAPEQTCTEFYEEQGILIPNFDATHFTNGTVVFCEVNGYTFSGAVTDYGVGVYDTEQFASMYIYYIPETQKAYVGGETLEYQAITSATVKVVVANYSYDWGTSAPPYDAVITTVADRPYVISGDYDAVAAKIAVFEPVKILVYSYYEINNTWWHKCQLTDYLLDTLNNRIRLKINDSMFYDWFSDGTVAYED